MCRRLLIVLGALLGGIQLLAQPFANGYIQPMPWADSLHQPFLPSFDSAPIGETDRIFVDGDGNFATQDGVIKFWGVNATTGGCFPLKSEAQAIAARMAKFGINLVRFHHLDNPAWSGSETTLFVNNQGTRTFDLVTLDRLDYFIYALKQHGIYVNMNLNVSRTFRVGDGVAGADSLQDFGKAVTLFDPYLEFLQQEYATDLLSHVNPYTGLKLAEDPVLAMVEMVNENSIYGFWKSDRLQTQDLGGALILRHHQLLDSLWIDFLRQKYAQQSDLEASWNQGQIPGGQGEQVVDGGFEGGNITNDWNIELHGGATATLSADTQNPGSGTQSAKVEVTNVTGTDWHIQFKQAGGSVDEDSTYVLRFMARSDASRDLSVSLMRDNSPYTWYSGQTYPLTTEWQTFEFYVTAPETNNGFLRVSFGFNNQVGDFWFDDVSLAKPSSKGLEAGESLAQGNIARIPYSLRLGYTRNRISDLAEFYIGLQRDFMGRMSQHLHTLGVQVPISGANALVGPADAFHQQDLDYLDDHSYWDHPWFPNTPWDPVDWQIGNSSVLRDPNVSSITGILGGLAPSNRPYTVSEYNHAFPNRFQAEMIPLLVAYGGFHDLDGLMFFDYSGSLNNWDENRINGFFSIHRNPVIMAQFPAAAYAFRQKLVAPADQVEEIAYSPDYVYQIPFEDDQGRWGKWLPYDQRLALTHSIKTSSMAAASAPDFTSLPSVGSSPYQTNSGETTLDTDQGWIKTETAHFAQIAGALDQAGVQHAGDFSLVQANGFGVISILALEDTSIRYSRTSLLTVVSKAQNSNMGWIGTQSVGSNWGNSPIEIEPLEASMDLTLQADSIRLLWLDGSGIAVDSQTILPFQPNRFRLNINQDQQPYFWFGIRQMGRGMTTNIVEQITAQQWHASLSSDQRVIQLSPGQVPSPLKKAEWLDAQGRIIQTWTSHEINAHDLSLPALSRGMYMLRIRHDDQLQSFKFIIR